MWRKSIEESKHSRQHKNLAKAFHDKKLLSKVSRGPLSGDTETFANCIDRQYVLS